MDTTMEEAPMGFYDIPDDVFAEVILLRFLDFPSIAQIEASSRRIRELVREREVMKRAVLLRYGGSSGGGGGGGRSDDDDDDEDSGGSERSESEPAAAAAAAAPGEASRQPIAGLPRADAAETPKESSLLWKRLGLALSSGFDEGATTAASEEEEGEQEGDGSPLSSSSSSSSSSLSLVADALAASSTDQPEEHCSNCLSPRSHPRRRWEPAAYWSSGGSADPESGEALSFRLAHPLCVATAVTVRPFEAHFQPGDPVYAPRSARLASGRSDCWAEALVDEWEAGRRRRGRERLRGGVAGEEEEGQGGLLRRWGGLFGRGNTSRGEEEEEAAAAAAAAAAASSSSSPFPLERFIATDARGLSAARTELVVGERRRAHPPSYPRFDGAFLRDNDGDFAAVSRALPVRKSGSAQRLSLIRGSARGEEEEEGGLSPSSPRQQQQRHRRRRPRRRRSAAGGAAAGAAAERGEALLMTGGHAVLQLRGRTQTQRGVDDLFYTCLSYAKVHGFAVRGLRVEFRPAEVEGDADAAAAAAARPPSRPALVPVLARIPEGRDPLFDRIPGGLAAVSERGRAASRAARRARALRSAAALFAAPLDELSPASRGGTRLLAEALAAAADDSASDEEEGEALFRRGGPEEEEEEEEGEEEEERTEAEGGTRARARERERERERREGRRGGVGGGREEDPEEAAKATLVSGLLLPDGSSFPVEAAMRMVRMLAAAFARRNL